MEFGKHVKVRQEKFGAVVFETLTEKVFVANETGGDILRLCKQGKSSEEIIAYLAENYDADPAVIKGEVEQFVAGLKDKNIAK